MTDQKRGGPQFLITNFDAVMRYVGISSPTIAMKTAFNRFATYGVLITDDVRTEIIKSLSPQAAQRVFDILGTRGIPGWTPEGTLKQKITPEQRELILQEVDANLAEHGRALYEQVSATVLEKYGIDVSAGTCCRFNKERERDILNGMV